MGSASTKLSFVWAIARIGCYRAFLACCGSAPPPRPQYDVVCIGLAEAGKTAALSALCGEDFSDDGPTKGFSIKATLLPKLGITVKELGGSEAYRKYWHRYYDDSIDGVVFAIDGSANAETLTEAISTFSTAMQHPSLNGLPVMVLVTKQDKEGAKSADDISSMIEPSKYANRKAVFAQCTVEDRKTVVDAFKDFGDALLGDDEGEKDS